MACFVQHQLDDTGTIMDHFSADADSPHAGCKQIALTHFQVDHTFELKGVGCVVSGCNNQPYVKHSIEAKCKSRRLA